MKSDEFEYYLDTRDNTVAVVNIALDRYVWTTVEVVYQGRDVFFDADYRLTRQILRNRYKNLINITHNIKLIELLK